MVRSIAAEAERQSQLLSADQRSVENDNFLQHDIFSSNFLCPVESSNERFVIKNKPLVLIDSFAHPRYRKSQLKCANIGPSEDNPL